MRLRLRLVVVLVGTLALNHPPTAQLGSTAKVGFTTMQRWLTFSPAKNDPGAGADSAKKGSPPGSPSSAEADFYSSYLTILETASGATIER